MKRTIHFLLFLAFGFHLLSANIVDKFRENKLLQNANISLLIKDLQTSKILYEFRPNNSIISASTMKVITTATALEMFGPEFRMATKLEIDGEITKDSVLNGDLYIKGGGDPTLGSAKIGDNNFISKWVDAVLNAGIKKINGRIIANDYFFEQQVINPKWTWEDVGNYYAPSIYGIAYMDNTFELIFKTCKVGTSPEIIQVNPEIPGLEIQNFVQITNTNSDNAYFYGAPFTNVKSVYGEIPANKNEFTVKGDIPNPGLLLAQHFHKKLNESGCEIIESPTSERINNCKKFAIYTHYSPTLQEIINETNKNSNNLYAEYLFKYIGTKTGIPGTVNQAITKIKSFWKSKGLSVDELFQCDGSGLSPSNAVSANFFVELLFYMKEKSKYYNNFYQSLSVSGENGTLKTILEKTPLKGKIHAKSGSMSRVKAYVGYIELNNQTLAFALLVNNANGTAKEITKKMEEFFLNVAKEDEKSEE